jgi:hypothetical protein
MLDNTCLLEQTIEPLSDLNQHPGIAYK